MDILFYILSILLLFRREKMDKNKVNLLRQIRDRFPFIRSIADQTGVPEKILLSVIAVETAGNPDAIGSSGESGLMQIMFGAVEDVNTTFGRNYSVFDLSVPISNVQIGALYLKLLHQRQGSWQKAIGRYNAITEWKQKVYYDKVNAYLKQSVYI